MATITLTPTALHGTYFWEPNTFHETEYFYFKAKDSEGYLFQMPSTSITTSAKVKQITISFIDGSSENVGGGSRVLYMGFSTSKTFPTSHQSGTINYVKNNGARQTFTINATPTVSINNTWYLEIYWDNEYNDVFTELSSIQITLTYSDDNTIMYHNGSGWVKCIPYYHNGSSWVKCKPYYHNGSSWVECSSS